MFLPRPWLAAASVTQLYRPASGERPVGGRCWLAAATGLPAGGWKEGEENIFVLCSMTEYIIVLGKGGNFSPGSKAFVVIRFEEGSG